MVEIFHTGSLDGNFKGNSAITHPFILVWGEKEHMTQ